MTEEGFRQLEPLVAHFKERIAQAEAEIIRLEKAITFKYELIRSWRKTVALYTPPQAAPAKE